MDGSNEGAADLGVQNQFIELRSDISGFSWPYCIKISLYRSVLGVREDLQSIQDI